MLLMAKKKIKQRIWWAFLAYFPFTTGALTICWVRNWQDQQSCGQPLPLRKHHIPFGSTAFLASQTASFHFSHSLQAPHSFFIASWALYQLHVLNNAPALVLFNTYCKPIMDVPVRECQDFRYTKSMKL